MNFDKFMEYKEKPGFKIFILLLEDEQSFLDSPSHWINNIEVVVHIVRLTLDEFQMLGVAMHPKILFFKDGRELDHCNGIPTLDAFRDKIREVHGCYQQKKRQ